MPGASARPAGSAETAPPDSKLAPPRIQAQSIAARLARLLLLSSGAFGWAGTGVARAAVLWQTDTSLLRWDTTLQQTEAFRLAPPDAALLADPNADDGDRHQTAGLISDRSDLFSEIDYSRNGFGANVGFDAWVDPVYLHANGNDDPATFNPVSVPSGALPSSVRQIEGLDADVLDAFVHDRFEIGGLPVTLRIGRHSLIWGESLFFGGNGIASLQAPEDLIRARNVPGSTAKELFLPVTQVSALVQLSSNLSVEFYDQPEWRRDRVVGVNTVFSTTDILDRGGERLFLPDGQGLLRGEDRTPAGASGQFGAALHVTSGGTDWGLYALEGDARSPLVATDPAAGSYRLLFPGHVGILGASVSGFVGSNNLAGELSLHRGVPVGAPGFLDAGEAIPRATSLDPQVSIVSQLPPTRAWASADLSAELAGNVVLAASPQAASVSQPSSGTAAFEAQFAPHYFHVLPGLDLTPSVTLAYGLTGRSGIDPEMVGGAGSLTVQLDADFRVLWHLELLYNHFVGAPSMQPLADRDFTSISVARSF